VDTSLLLVCLSASITSCPLPCTTTHLILRSPSIALLNHSPDLLCFPFVWQFTVIGMAPMNFKPFFDSYVKQAFRGASDMSTLLYTLKQVGGLGSFLPPSLLTRLCLLVHRMDSVLSLLTRQIPFCHLRYPQSMIRHTKLQVLGGEQVLQLPPKTEEVVAGEIMQIRLTATLPAVATMAV